MENFNIKYELLKILSILHYLSYDVNIYLVGGFLRDYLLGKESKELDFIIAPFSYETLNTFSKILKGRIIPLDEERKYFRIITNINNKDYIFDFTTPLEKSLLDELKRRDFTINTILFDIKNLKVIDLLNGIKDLKEGKLRICSEISIKEDPLRILRAFRFISNFGFRLTPETEREILNNKDRLANIKGERIHEEIYKILKASFTKDIFIKMNDMGILEKIFPELKELENIPWNAPHHTNPLLHSIEALGKLEYFYYYYKNIFQDYKNYIEDYLKEKIYSDFTKKELIKLAVLLHDIGKSKTFFIGEDKRVHYYGHENLGSLMIENIANRLKLSKKEEILLKKLIKNHLYPSFIFKDNKANRLKIINRLGEDTIGLIFLFLGDQFSIRPLKDLIIFSQEIFELYINRKEIKPILSGDEIMEYFSLKPSPLIGKLKDLLINAQQDGRVKNKESAIKFIEEILEHEINRK